MLVLAMPGVEDILLVFLLLASYSDLGSSTSKPWVYRGRPEVFCRRCSRQCRSRALLAGGHSIRPPLRYRVEQGDLSYWVGVDARSTQS